MVCVCKSAAQDSIQVTEGFHENPAFNGRKVLARGLVCALVATSLVWSYKVWWEDATKPFGFCSEGWFSGKRLGVDKTGHFFVSYFFHNTLRNVMLWGGYKRTTANWWAAGATAYLAIEIGGGVRRDGIGFDYQDLLFNLGGIGYGWLQTEVPILRNFNFKWSYVLEAAYEFPPHFTRHYDAHTYWLGFNINELLPSSMGRTDLTFCSWLLAMG